MPVSSVMPLSGQPPDHDRRWTEEDFDYAYPRGLDLKPGSKLHEKIRKRIWERVFESHTTMSSRYSEWREMDRVLKVYVSPDHVSVKYPRHAEGFDGKAAAAAGYGREDNDPLTRIVMPMTYANMETLLTYMSAAFLQDPIFTYEGAGPEDLYGAELMTYVVSRQVARARIGLNLHTQWRDAFAYGIGVTHPRWEVQEGRYVSTRTTGFFNEMKNLFVTTKTEKQVKKKVVWEGNRLDNIDPYRYFPDTKVAAQDIGRGEFASWLDEDSYYSLLSRERDKSDFLFNVRYLRTCQGVSSLGQAVSERRNGNDGISRGVQEREVGGQVDVLYVYIDLIPQEWGLGRGRYPETWLFMLAGDRVIIAAEKVNLVHGRKPVIVAAPDYDGYSSTPSSRLHATMDIQRMVDFLHTSHITNIRKAINDMIVADPWMINMHDLRDPKAGKIIRLRKSAWGRGGVDSAIKQLAVQDVTAGHVGDASMLMSMANDTVGSADNLRGMISRGGERVSASEAQGARSSGLARLERLAKIISMQAMQETALIFASHTQQFMTEDMFVKVTGELGERLRKEYGADVDSNRVLVDPMDLLVEFDLVERDGTIPGSQNVDGWLQVLQIVSQSPQLSAGLDMPRIVRHIGRQLGATNIDDFIVAAQNSSPPQVMDDAQTMEQVDAGNLVPMPASAPEAAGAPPTV